MQPFSIICQTCAAKLKVQKPNAIGQRLACPKCGNMLKVVPPQDWQPPDDLPPAVRQRLEELNLPTQSFDFDDMDAIIASANAPASSSKTKPDASSVEEPSRLSPKEAVKSVRQRSNLPQKKRSPQTPESESGPLLPNAQWTSDSEKRKRKILVLSLAIVASIVVIGAGITTYLVNQPQTANADVGQESDPPNDSAPEKDASEKELTDDGPNTKSDSEDSKDEKKESNSTNLETSSTAPEPAQNDPELGNPPDLTPPDMTPSDPGAQTPDEITPPDQQKKPQPNELDDNPMVLPEIPTGPADPQSPLSAASILDNIVATAPALSGFEAIFEASGSSFTELEDIAEASERIELGTPKYFIEPTAPRRIFLEKVLSTRFKNIRYEELPVHFLLNELAVFGMAWEFDTTELAAQNFDFKKTVSLDLEDVTLEEIYEELATQLGLATSTSADPVPLITFSPANKNTVVEHSYAFPFQKTESLEALVKAIPDLITPGSWPKEIDQALAIREGQVQVTSSPFVQRQMADLESAMAAVATYNRDPLDAAHVANLIPLPLQLDEQLRKPLGLEPQLRVPLWVFLEQLEQKSGIQFLVDWSEATKLGWLPETTVPGNIVEPDLESVLKHLCHSLNMAWVVIDKNTIELTSNEKAAERIFVAAYPFQRMLTDKVTPNDVKNFVFGTVLGKQIQRPNVRILDQVESLSFIVVAPQSLHKKIAPIMSKLRGERP